MDKIKRSLQPVIIWLVDGLISIDQLFNWLLLGKPDETLSSRAYRAECKGKVFGKIFRPLIDKIFWFQENHCYKAYESELLRFQLPEDFKV
jgi:hypothetical protein